MAKPRLVVAIFLKRFTQFADQIGDGQIQGSVQVEYVKECGFYPPVFHVLKPDSVRPGQSGQDVVLSNVQQLAALELHLVDVLAVVPAFHGPLDPLWQRAGVTVEAAEHGVERDIKHVAEAVHAAQREHRR